MARISPEEKRREAADWFKGLFGLILILSLIIAGYLVFQNTKMKVSQQNNLQSKPIPSHAPKI